MEATQYTLPDAYFYYGLSIVTAFALVAVLRWVGARITTAFDKLVEDVTELKISKAIHAKELSNHKEQLEALNKKTFPVQYFAEKIRSEHGIK